MLLSFNPFFYSGQFYVFVPIANPIIQNTSSVNEGDDGLDVRTAICYRSQNVDSIAGSHNHFHLILSSWKGSSIPTNESPLNSPLG
jgi:hypothetical protein